MLGRIEPGVVAHDVDKAADEQASRGEEDNGERNFKHKKTMAEKPLFAAWVMRMAAD